MPPEARAGANPRAAAKVRCRVYLVTPPRIDDAFPARLKDALDGGDVACLQLRLKEATDDEVLRAAEALLRPLHERDAALIVNDRPDLAKRAGADGVHVGHEDPSIEDARAVLGGDSIVGATCQASRHRAMEAGEKGADYVAFGAFFETATKATTARAGLELLEWWSGIFEIPCVAIGGITAGNCAPLVRAGADFLAVSAAVWAHPGGPAAGVRALNEAIARSASA